MRFRMSGALCGGRGGNISLPRIVSDVDEIYFFYYCEGEMERERVLIDWCNDVRCRGGGGGGSLFGG